MRIRRLAPDVLSGANHRTRLVWLHGNLIERVHAERRDEILLEVLVLIVAPYQHQVGSKGVERLACAPKSFDERRAMSARGRQSFVVTPLLAHGCGPALRVALRLWRSGVLEVTAQDVRHVLV